MSPFYNLIKVFSFPQILFRHSRHKLAIWARVTWHIDRKPKCTLCPSCMGTYCKYTMLEGHWQEEHTAVSYIWTDTGLRNKSS